MKRIIPIVALATLLLLSACGQSAADISDSALTAVSLASVEVGDIEVRTSFNGQIKADSQAAVSAKIPGKVLAVYKNVGDKVNAGEVLAAIDGTDLSHQLRQLNAQIAQAQAGIKVTENSVAVADENVKVIDAGRQAAQANLSRTQGTSEQQLAAAKSAVEQARLGLETAQINYDTINLNHTNNLELFKSGAIPKITLDQTEAQLQTAKISVDNAKRALDDAETNLQLAQSTLLPEAEAAAAAQYQQTDAQHQQMINQRAQVESQVAQAKAGLAALQAQRDAIAANINSLNITSPIAGVVAERSINPGETAGVAPLFIVTNTSGVSVETNVTERIISSLTVGDTVGLRIKALGQESFQGTIEYISPQIASNGTGFPVKVRMDNSDEKIKGGMFAEVDFVTEFKGGVLMVPLEAVLTSSGKDSVYVCENGIVKAVEVQLGTKNSDYAEVLSGINQGDEVVIKGQHFIADGQQVNVVS